MLATAGSKGVIRTAAAGRWPGNRPSPFPPVTPPPSPTPYSTMSCVIYAILNLQPHCIFVDDFKNCIVSDKYIIKYKVSNKQTNCSVLQ